MRHPRLGLRRQGLTSGDSEYPPLNRAISGRSWRFSALARDVEPAIYTEDMFKTHP